MILGILVFAFIMWISLGYQSEEVKANCDKGHKWYYQVVDGVEDQHLSCQNCKRRPGDE